MINPKDLIERIKITIEEYLTFEDIGAFIQSWLGDLKCINIDNNISKGEELRKYFDLIIRFKYFNLKYTICIDLGEDDFDAKNGINIYGAIFGIRQIALNEIKNRQKMIFSETNKKCYFGKVLKVKDYKVVQYGE